MTHVARDSGAWVVPDFTVASYRPKVHRTCLCVFVLDEGERIRSQLAKMAPYAEQIDILVADGGSSDGSLDPAIVRSFGVRSVLTKQGPGKLSAQMRMAFAYALEQGYEGIVTIDGNDKDDPAAIPSFVAALEAGADHLQGSRFVPGGKAVNTPWTRLLGIHLVHAPLISLAAGVRYTDTTNGFRGYSRRFLLDGRVAPFRAVFETYELHYYLAIRAARLGFRVQELPVTRRYPRCGPAPTKISPFKGNLMILGILLKACLSGYSPVATRRLAP